MTHTGDTKLGKEISFRHVERNGYGGITGIDATRHMWLSVSSMEHEVSKFRVEDNKPINEQRFFHAKGVCKACSNEAGVVGRILPDDVEA